VKNQSKSITILQSISLFKKEFRGFDEIAINCEKFNFSCPYTQSLFSDRPKGERYLGRGKLCTHFQCFDLRSYFDINIQNGASSLWTCPICLKRSLELVRDLFFEALVETLPKKKQSYSINA